MVNATLLRIPLAISFLLALAGFGWQEIKAQGADLMPVRYVRVEGAFQYIARKSIKEVLDEQVVRGFYNVDLQNIKNAVKKLSWADQVEVQRIWPDALKVSITEQHPVARWRENSLLNARGELFIPGNIVKFAQLPLIFGPDGQQEKLLSVIRGLRVSFGDRAMNLAEFHVNNRRAWRVILSNGLEIKVGRKTPLKNIQRFLSSIELLGEERVAMMAIVDLRYPNGYAVTWKDGVEPIDWKKVAIEKSKSA